MQPVRVRAWTSRSRHGSAWSGCIPCTVLWLGTPAPCRWASGQTLQRQTQRSDATSPCPRHPPLSALLTSPPPPPRSAAASPQWTPPLRTFSLCPVSLLRERKTCGDYPTEQTRGLGCEYLLIAWIKLQDANAIKVCRKPRMETSRRSLALYLKSCVWILKGVRTSNIIEAHLPEVLCREGKKKPRHPKCAAF